MDQENATTTPDIPDKKQHKTARAKEQAIARLENHRFKPGQSGNPKGRPKKSKVREILPGTKEVRAILDEEVPMVIRLKLQAMYRYQVPDKPLMLEGKPVMKEMEGEPLPEHLTYSEANARRPLRYRSDADENGSTADKNSEEQQEAWDAPGRE